MRCKLAALLGVLAALVAAPAIAGSVNGQATQIMDPSGLYAATVHPAGTLSVQCDVGCSGSAGVADTHAQTGALAASLVAKASAGTLYSFEVQADSTLDGAAWWVMIFDATSLPVDGAVTPAKCYEIPSGTPQMGGTFGTAGIAFTAGIVVGVSTTGCFTKTASAHAFIAADYQ